MITLSGFLCIKIACVSRKKSKQQRRKRRCGKSTKSWSKVLLSPSCLSLLICRKSKQTYCTRACSQLTLEIRERGERYKKKCSLFDMIQRAQKSERLDVINKNITRIVKVLFCIKGWEKFSLKENEREKKEKKRKKERDKIRRNQRNVL